MRAWWRLTLENVDFAGMMELNDTDREHIAKLIKEGYSEGEIIHE